MLKTKRFDKPSYIIHHSKNQLGNTLIPVIIALAISAVASVSFLKKGADLSTQAKVLEAQYEIADLLQQWNRIKSTTPNITLNDLPPNITTDPALITLTNPNLVLGSLALGWGLGLKVVKSSPDYASLRYNLGRSDMKLCLKLATMFSSDMEGISNLYDASLNNFQTNSNPGCVKPGILGVILVIRLD